MEGFVKEALSIFVSPLAAADRAEICDHLALMLIVAELPEEDERLLEMLNRDRNAPGMNERKSEVVERQRLGVPVA